MEKVRKHLAGAVLVMMALVVFAGCKGKGGDEAITNQYIVATAANFPASAPTPITTFSWTTLYNTWVTWSISSQGEISDATLLWTTITAGGGTSWLSASDAFDDYGLLHVHADVSGVLMGQPYNPVTTGVSFEDSSYELAFPVQTLMGVEVSRKVYANLDADYTNKQFFARWLEILTNNTANPITVNVVIGGNLGSDSTTNVIASQDGDLLPEADDNWIVTGDNTASATTFGDPLVGHIFDGNGGVEDMDNLVGLVTTAPTALNFRTAGWTTTAYTVSAMTRGLSTDSLVYSWTGVELQPGETKAIMHLALLGLGNVVPGFYNGLADMQTMSEAMVNTPPAVLAGMDADEINGVVNWPLAVLYCNVRGAAWTLLPNQTVTVNNNTKSTTAQSYTRADGSWGVCINASAGDLLDITDGTNAYSVTVQ